MQRGRKNRPSARIKGSSVDRGCHCRNKPTPNFVAQNTREVAPAAHATTASSCRTTSSCTPRSFGPGGNNDSSDHRPKPRGNFSASLRRRERHFQRTTRRRYPSSRRGAGRSPAATRPCLPDLKQAKDAFAAANRATNRLKISSLRLRFSDDVFRTSIGAWR
jgi:hypothetical protein